MFLAIYRQYKSLTDCRFCPHGRVFGSKLNFGIWNDNTERQVKPTKKSRHKYSSLYSAIYSSLFAIYSNVQ